MVATIRKHLNSFGKGNRKLIVYLSPIALIVLVIDLIFNISSFPKWITLVILVVYTGYYIKYRGDVNKVK